MPSSHLDQIKEFCWPGNLGTDWMKDCATFHILPHRAVLSSAFITPSESQYITLTGKKPVKCMQEEFILSHPVMWWDSYHSTPWAWQEAIWVQLTPLKDCEVWTWDMRWLNAYDLRQASWTILWDHHQKYIACVADLTRIKPPTSSLGKHLPSTTSQHPQQWIFSKVRNLSPDLLLPENTKVTQIGQ